MFILSASLAIGIYNANGVGWDFLSRYLDGRTLASGYFYPHLGLFDRKVTAYVPYQCNSTMEKMPILVFNNTGVRNYCTGSIYNLTNISTRFEYTNFSIYLPDNYSCVK